MILKVGLTGGIASGKSTVARTLESLGCSVLDADRVVSLLYRPGAPGHTALVEHFGKEILDDDGEVDRQRLSAVALCDDQSALKLNGLIHPLVILMEDELMEEERKRVGEGDLIYVVEATLLLEAGGRKRYDRIVVVDSEPEQQIARGLARGMDRPEVIRRMARQMEREERLKHADYVITNEGTLSALQEETERIHEALKNDLAVMKRAQQSC